MKKHTSPDSQATFSEILEQRKQSHTNTWPKDNSETVKQIPPPEALKNSFREWKADLDPTEVSQGFYQAVETHAIAFENIIDKAAAEGGYMDPIGFLKTLSSQEMETLRAIHSLAKPIQIGTLSKEGALNLLVPRTALFDINKDGFTMVGAAKMWQFPPVDAPVYVKEAWKKATEGMSGKDIMMAQATFMPFVREGESAYIGNQSYSSIVKKAIAGAEFSKKYDAAWQYEARKKQIAFLQRFLEAIQFQPDAKATETSKV